MDVSCRIERGVGNTLGERTKETLGDDNINRLFRRTFAAASQFRPN